LTGRHALAGAPHRRRTRLVLAGALAVILVAAGAVAVWWPRGGAPAPAAALGQPTAAPSSAPADRGADRPSRGGTPRADRPRPRPSPSPSEREPEPDDPAPAPDPTPLPDGGQVVTSGSCEASYYWEPQPTASGEVFDPEAMTAAHKEWDFDTRVRVTNPASGDSVVVRINDRGPYIDGRCLDLSRGAFREIASLDAGVITVTYEVLSD
jgi:rare lipoprotein A